MGVVVGGLQTCAVPCVLLRSEILGIPTGETAKFAVRSGGIPATSLLHLGSIRSPALGAPVILREVSHHFRAPLPHQLLATRHYLPLQYIVIRHIFASPGSGPLVLLLFRPAGHTRDSSVS